MNISNLLLLASATVTALIAGLFYAYSCSVNRGLSKLTDADYLAAMQSINREILNPLFFLSFMGTLVLLPLSTILHYKETEPGRFILLLVATLVYAIGAFAVTIFGNVPLNNELDRARLSSMSPVELNHLRMIFEKPWNRLHTVRTLAAVLALVLVLAACLVK